MRVRVAARESGQNLLRSRPPRFRYRTGEPARDKKNRERTALRAAAQRLRQTVTRPRLRRPAGKSDPSGVLSAWEGRVRSLATQTTAPYRLAKSLTNVLASSIE